MGRARHCVSSCYRPMTPVSHYVLPSNYLSSMVGMRSQYPLKRPIFSSDVAVQTESTAIETYQAQAEVFVPPKQDNPEEPGNIPLTASDLASILRWSKDISSDMSLSSGITIYLAFHNFICLICVALQRLTEIVTGKILLA